MKIIGIDPGEAWTGVAALDIGSNGMHTKTRVFRSDARRLADLVDEVVPGGPDVHIVAENFSVRPVGFNAFSQGQTLRILGALQYATEKRSHTWTLVPPADPDAVLHQL